MSPLFQQGGRDSLRRTYLEAWRKARSGECLTPLESQIARVIEEHPEYQERLTHGEDAIAEDFGPERGQPNPFLHLGLHLALRDQIVTNRPAGIARIHRRLVRRLRDPHAAEHAMVEILGELLWAAQRAGAAPDEAQYLDRLSRL